MSFINTLYRRKWKNGEESIQTTVLDKTSTKSALSYRPVTSILFGVPCMVPTWMWNL